MFDLKKNTLLEKEIEKFKRLMNSNQDQIRDLETINGSLKESMVSKLKCLLDSHFGLTANLITKSKLKWNKEDIPWVQDRLMAYYDLDVEVTELSTLGYGSDAYYINFKFRDDETKYRLTIPNLKGVENYEDCHRGYHTLHYYKSRNFLNLIDEVPCSYRLDELILNLFKWRKGKSCEQ